jgi:hypothetical protein
LPMVPLVLSNCDIRFNSQLSKFYETKRDEISLFAKVKIREIFR